MIYNVTVHVILLYLEPRMLLMIECRRAVNSINCNIFFHQGLYRLLYTRLYQQGYQRILPYTNQMRV